MRRQLIEVIDMPQNMNSVVGVYVFYVGDMFYIGRTISVKSRLRAHAKRISHCLLNYDQYANNIAQSRKDISGMYFRIAKYMYEHPKIEGIRVSRIYPVSNHIDLCIKEFQLLRLYENHPDCFNVSFSCSIFHREVKPKGETPKKKKRIQAHPARPSKAQLLRVLQQIRNK